MNEIDCENCCFDINTEDIDKEVVFDEPFKKWLIRCPNCITWSTLSEERTN